MTATTSAAWFIRPFNTANDGRRFLVVAKDAETGCEAVATGFYGMEKSFRTVEAARQYIRDEFHGGTRFCFPTTNWSAIFPDSE